MLLRAPYPGGNELSAREQLSVLKRLNWIRETYVPILKNIYKAIIGI